MKLCIRCKETKPKDLFYKWTRAVDGRQVWCKWCDKEHKKTTLKVRLEYAKQWAKNNPERYEAMRRGIEYRSRLKKYGCTEKEVEEALKVQQGSCAICGCTDKTLHIDHCHLQLKFRGLLCFNCNGGLGQFKDNPEFLVKASHYLKKFCNQYKGSKE